MIRPRKIKHEGGKVGRWYGCRAMHWCWIEDALPAIVVDINPEIINVFGFDRDQQLSAKVFIELTEDKLRSWFVVSSLSEDLQFSHGLEDRPSKENLEWVRKIAERGEVIILLKTPAGRKEGQTIYKIICHQVHNGHPLEPVLMTGWRPDPDPTPHC